MVPCYITFKQQRRRQVRKRHLKSEFAPPQTLSRLFHLIWFNSSNVGKLLWSWILKDCFKVREKEEKTVVLCSRPRQNVKTCVTAKKCAKRRDACAKLFFGQSKPIGSLPFSLPSPSSLPKLHSMQGMQNADTCTHGDYGMWDVECGMRDRDYGIEGKFGSEWRYWRTLIRGTLVQGLI